MTDPAAERWTRGAYRALLRLYPRSFRRAYGAEAERVGRDLLRDERGRGGCGSHACGRVSSATCCRPRSESEGPG